MTTPDLCLCAMCDKAIDHSKPFFTANHEHPSGEAVTLLWLDSRECLNQFEVLAKHERDALFIYMGRTVPRLEGMRR